MMHYKFFEDNFTSKKIHTYTIILSCLKVQMANEKKVEIIIWWTVALVILPQIW